MKTFLFILSLLVTLTTCFASNSTNSGEGLKSPKTKHLKKSKSYACKDIGIQKIKVLEFQQHRYPKNPKAEGKSKRSYSAELTPKFKPANHTFNPSLIK